MADTLGSYLEVSATEIADLTSMPFTELCNALLHSERRRVAESIAAVDVTTNINAPDGGVDALTAFDSETEFVPRGETAWQYKAGSAEPAALAKEIRALDEHSLLIRRLRAGAGYVLLAATDRPPAGVAERLKAIRDALADRGLAQTDVQVFCASHIAEWVNDRPGIVARLFNKVPAEFQPVARALEQPRHNEPFEPDPQRTALIKRINAEFSKAGGEIRIRIEGPAGIGKTRTALEALRERSDDALFAQRAPEDPAFGRLLTQSGRSAILILDECDAVTANEWFQAVAGAEGRIRLLTVDVSEAGHAGSGAIELSGLDKPQIMAVAGRAATTLGQPQLEWVADVCDGFVKLAAPLAQALATAPGAGVDDLVSTRDVRHVLNLLIEDGIERRVMTGLSLFVRAGFRDELQRESRAIADYLGVDWHAFHAAATRMIDRGLLAERGRYVYVTPRLLAVWLMARELETQGLKILDVLMRDGAPPNPRFWSRVGQLEGNRDARALAREALGPAGPFRSMAALDSEDASYLFRELCRVAPRETATLIERLIGDSSNPDLKAMTAGRRHLVWALEELAVRRDCFQAAATSLLRLAAAENESYGNNASGVFKGLFQVFLGRTLVPVQERLDLLDRLLVDANRDEAAVAIAALASPLSSSEVGTPIGGGGAPPTQNWRPGSVEEVDEVRQRAFGMLVRELRSEDEVRRQSAALVLRTQLRSLVILGLGARAREELDGIDLEAGGDQERELLSVIGHIIEYDAPELDASERAAWEEFGERTLYGSFRRRMLSLVRGWDSRSDLPLDDSDLRDDIRALAREAAERPDLLDSELSWLCANEYVPNIDTFGRALGEEDARGALAERLIAAAADAGDPRLLAYYIDGRRLEGRALDSLLDLIEGETPARAFLPRLLGRLPNPSRFWERYRRSISDTPSNQSALDDIAVTRLAEELSDEELPDLVRVLLKRGTPASMEIALRALDGRLEGRGADEDLVGLAWQVLERGEGVASNGMWSYQWSRVAGDMIQHDRPRMVRALLGHAKTGPARFTHSRLAAALIEAMSGADVALWEQFIELLDADPQLESSLRSWSQEVGFLERMPIPTLEAWAGSDPVRLERLAALVKPQETLSPLVIWLVECAGPESRAARRIRSQIAMGVFAGSMADREKGFIDLFERWANDAPSEAIRAWAREGALESEARLPTIERWDDESELSDY